MPGDSTEPPGSPSLPPTCPRTPSVLRGLAGRAEPLPQLLEGLPTLQQDPRAPPEVLAAGSRGGREGLHSPDGSAPTCGAISHWGGGQLVTGGASLLGGGAGNGHGDTKHCCHGPKFRSGSQRYRTDTGQAAPPWHSQPSPGGSCSKPPRVLRGRAAVPRSRDGELPAPLSLPGLASARCHRCRPQFLAKVASSSAPGA